MRIYFVLVRWLSCAIRAILIDIYAKRADHVLLVIHGINLLALLRNIDGYTINKFSINRFL